MDNNVKKDTKSRKKGSTRRKKGDVVHTSGKMSPGVSLKMTAEVKKKCDEDRIDRAVMKWMIDMKRLGR